MSELATREVDIVSEITASISRMLTREVSLSKILGKNYSFQVPSKLVIFSDLLNSTEKNLNGRKVSMGIFPYDLEQVYDIVIEHRLCQTG